jgi:hexulose-6-phosphate isomerase
MNLTEEAYVVKKAMCYGSLPGKLSDREKAALAKGAGLDAVELHQYGTVAEAEKVAGIARDAGLEIASLMCMTHWGSPLSSTDEEVRLKGVAGVAAALRQAQAIGAEVVLVVPGVVTEDVSYKAAYGISRRSLQELLPVAEETGVIMALENVWNRFLLSPLEMRDFIDSFNSPLVQAYFDVGNILLYGYPHHWIEALGARIKRVHIKDFDMGTGQFVGLLQGSVDFPRVVAALRGVGYDGYLTAEVGPYKQYPEQFVRDTAAQLEQIVKR